MAKTTNNNGDKEESGNGAAGGYRPSNEYVLNFAFYSFVGFTLFQAGFAMIANSESMMADCEAMVVDAMTYLFNLCAERIKNKPYSEAELELSPIQRTLRRDELRLWLELVPPAFSVSCLITIVIMTLNESIKELWGVEAGDEDDVSVPIMLAFSGANLLLDVFNVVCFARSGHSFGLQSVRDGNEEIRSSMKGLKEKETTALVESPVNSGDAANDDDEMENGKANNNNGYGSFVSSSSSSSSSQREQKSVVMNLNMCSAWTHVCADTLRSISVLVAAAIATVFPSIPGDLSDSVAAIAVSIIILVSLGPLIQGLVITAIQLYRFKRDFGSQMR